MKSYKYRGCNIVPYSGRTPYWRWEAFVSGVGFVYGSTLEGMRELIRANTHA